MVLRATRARLEVWVRRRWLLAGLLIGMVATAACEAGAPLEFTVDTVSDLTDPAPGDGLCGTGALGGCSLRAAVQEANATPGRQQIGLTSATFTLALPGTEEDAGATGDLDITDALTILGQGATIDAAGIDRALDVHDASVIALDLTITGGAAPDGAGVRLDGGAARLERSTIVGNQATVGAGGIDGSATSLLILDSSTITGNTGAAAGGARSDLMLVSNSTVSGNTATAGAAVTAGTLLLIDHATVTTNEGGGIDPGDALVEIGSSAIGDQMTGPDCWDSGTISSRGFNVDTDGTCAHDPTDATAATLGLAPLTDNGGGTATHLPSRASPLVDAIDAALPICATEPSADQRQHPRPVGSGCDVGAVERSTSGPNVVVIMTDDQWLDAMSVMPSTRALIGDAGITFAESTVAFPMCCPSRATYLTGQYGHNNGVEYNLPDLRAEVPDGGYMALDGADTFPVWLTEAGYTTAHIGKYLNGYGDPQQNSSPTEVPPGWAEWYGLLSLTTYYYQDYIQNENGEVVCYGSPVGSVQCSRSEPAEYQTDLLARQAVEFVTNHADDEAPFFLDIAPIAPHASSDHLFPTPAPRHAGAYDGIALPNGPAFNEADMSDKSTALRDAPLLDEFDLAILQGLYENGLESLLAVDELVGSVVASLDAAGILDNTVIIFTSDNSQTFGDHRLLTGKYDFYEPAIRVPLLIRGPGFPAGRVVTQPASNIDLAPTIMGVTGVTAGHAVDGIDLRTLVDDPSHLTDRPLLIESGDSRIAWIVSKHWYTAVRTPDWVYAEIATTAGTEFELYELQADPHQLDSVAGQVPYAAIEATLAAELERLRDCAGTTCN